LPYNFIIGLATIRRYKLALVFGSLFEEVEGIKELYPEDTIDKIYEGKSSSSKDIEKKDVKSASYTSALCAESAIKRSSVRPIFASRGHGVDDDAAMQPSAECNRPSATPMGGNPSNSVACK
jgi:hypothetical protein